MKKQRPILTWIIVTLALFLTAILGLFTYYLIFVADHRSTNQRTYDEYQSTRYSYPNYVVEEAFVSDAGYTTVLMGVDVKGEKHLIDAIHVFSELEQSGWIIAYTYTPGTDSGAREYIAFNKNTKELKVLRTAGRYIRYGVNKKQLSPDGEQYISTYATLGGEDTRTMYVIDLVSDSEVNIHTLATGETLVESFRHIDANPVTNMEWLNANTIRYSVFKQSQKVEGKATAEGPVNTFLRTETFDLSSKKVISLNIP